MIEISFLFNNLKKLKKERFDKLYLDWFNKLIK